MRDVSRESTDSRVFQESRRRDHSPPRSAQNLKSKTSVPCGISFFTNRQPIYVKIVFSVHDVQRNSSRLVSPKVRQTNPFFPPPPDRKRAVTRRECTIDKRFLVPKIYPGSIVKNSGTYRYRSGRRGRGEGKGWIILSVDIGAPLLKLERFARTTPAHQFFFRSFAPSFSLFPPPTPPFFVSFSSRRTESFRCGCAR